MVDYRKVLELYFDGHLTVVDITRRCGYANTTLKSFLKRFKLSCMKWPLDEKITNEDIRQMLYKDSKLNLVHVHPPEDTPVNSEDHTDDSAAIVEKTEEVNEETTEEKTEETTEETSEEVNTNDCEQAPEEESEEADDFNINDIEPENEVNRIDLEYEYRTEGSAKGTLCWDCKKATCGCMWSDFLEPVPGWTATPSVHRDTISYKVIKCPDFVRDARNNGLTRLEKPSPDEEKARIAL